jgi:hypothetical protein
MVSFESFMRRIAPAPLLALVTLSHSAGAAPLERDIDNDRFVDRVELDAAGDVVIHTRNDTAKVAVGLKTARLSGGLARGIPTIVVRGDTEAVVLQRTGTQWKILVRTPVGGVGLDADYGVDVEATADGVFRFQTRPELSRCDGKPALLFGERFDGGKFRRLARLPVGIADSALVLVARREEAAAGPVPTPLQYKARFASHQIGAADAGSLGVPSELDDGKLDTAWREELVASTGEGQFFMYVPRTPDTKAAQIRIVTAAQKDANRPQRLGVVTRRGEWHVDLPADVPKDPPGTAYVVDLPAPVDGCVTVILESTFGPDKGTTQIAELGVYAEGERSGGGEVTLAKVIADGGPGATSAAKALSTRGAAAAAAIDAELGRVKAGAARRRLVRAAVEVVDPAIAPILARIASQNQADGAELVAVIEALGRFGYAQELHDLAVRRDLPAEIRAAAARGLRPQIDKDRDLLVSLAGIGNTALRRAVIESLSSVPVPLLAAAAGTATEPAAAGDLWRAVTRRAHRTTDERPEAIAQLSSALAAATDYERRYRIVDGLAALGGADVLKTLAAWLGKLPADAETGAYKQIAARAIATNPRTEATDLLVTLTHDVDPGVRLAALSAIASATGTTAGAWHGNAGPDGIDRVIVTMLSTDTWPEVRRSAAQVLGERCTRPGPAAALVSAVTRDPDLSVRGDALAGLVQCKATGTAALLATLWDDGKAPLDLRRRAVDLTAVLGDRALAGKLVGKLTQWRGAAIESEEALALAQNAAYAIGAAGAPGAAEALSGALDDSAFPEIVAAAATGLGLLGPACPPAALRKLQSLRDSDEQQVQIAARRAVSICGKR